MTNDLHIPMFPDEHRRERETTEFLDKWRRERERENPQGWINFGAALAGIYIVGSVGAFIYLVGSIVYWMIF